KNQRLCEVLARHDATFAALEAVAFPALIAALFVTSGFGAGASAGACMLINIAYSRWFKARSVIDVLVVGAWGAAFAAIADTTMRYLLAIGLMTAISHVFQALLDQ